MIMYIQFMLMLIEFQRVLSQELKCLCSKTTKILSESMVPETVAISFVYIFIVLEVIKYII
jgi:hypothetical protein